MTLPDSTMECEKPHPSASRRRVRLSLRSSDGLGLRGEGEGFELEGGQERGVLPLAAADALGGADHLDVAGREHADDALVEAEVFDRVFDTAALDVPDAVARESREGSRARV